MLSGYANFAFALVVPKIVIGNITVGGCGKTPTVLAMYNFLKSHGFKPAVISRGYGGKAEHYPMYVTPESVVTDVGDEPYMLALADVKPLLVAPKRVDSIKEIVANTDCNIIISDDGLQHYAMQRDIEIALFDAKVGVGNGFMLPAGMLREPLTRLRSVDFILFKGGAKGRPKLPCLQKSHDLLISPHGFHRVSDFSTPVQIQEIQSAKKLVALAGIANPESFFTLLQSLGIKCETISFPDHKQFVLQDIDLDADFVLMTEKDAVKCQGFADARHVYLAINADFTADFQLKLLRKIEEIA